MKTNRPPLLALALLLCLGSGLAQASSTWRLVASDKGRSIEVDTASVLREADGKVVATGRVVLDKEIKDLRSGELYKTIQTTTRFDCTQRTAQTLKRSFLRANEEVLREEEVRTASAMPVRSGTLDDRALRELCRPPGSRGEAVRVVEKAKVAATALRAANEAMVQRQVQAAPRGGSKFVARPAQAKKASSASKPLLASELPTPESRHVVWAYEGPGGPSHWGELQPEYTACRNGQRQSPIDIRDGIQVDLEPVQFEYQPGPFEIYDSGYGIEVRAGGNRLSLMGKNYELERIRFHRPAEETIEGRVFDMGVHLEHQAFDGERLVVAVLLEKGVANPLVQTLWNYLPLEKRMRVAPPSASIDLNGLLPSQRGYHTYMGSLTRPPCSEGVVWVVLQTPVQISAEQEAIFARLYPRNARPVQPSGNRLIKSSRQP